MLKAFPATVQRRGQLQIYKQRSLFTTQTCNFLLFRQTLSEILTNSFKPPGMSRTWLGEGLATLKPKMVNPGLQVVHVQAPQTAL